MDNSHDHARGAETGPEQKSKEEAVGGPGQGVFKDKNPLERGHGPVYDPRKDDKGLVKREEAESREAEEGGGPGQGVFKDKSVMEKGHGPVYDPRKDERT